MTTLRVTILNEPIASARPRVVTRGGHAHAYMPSKTVQAQWRIREALTAAAGPDWCPLAGPVRLTVTAYVRMPASIPKRDRLTALPYRRPDLDNLVKTVMDGASILWRDDAQVVELHASKRYAVDSLPCWEITIESMVMA
jgi:Holliday junction resolvase RusA-like endonuclease